MKSIILFQNKILMGTIPYKNYNCSIIKLSTEETYDITNGIYNEESIFITFFVSSPGKRYGTMSWIGIMSYKNLIKILDDKTIHDDKNFWFIKPHLLQNDKGPKCADLRIFKMKKNIGVIGYTRLAPRSNTKDIGDYYVRTSILSTKNNNKLYENPEELFHFLEIDGGCFPSVIGNQYKKFKINNDDCKLNNIEFYIKDNNTSKLITPHKSKNKMMPNKMKLNGIEVSFLKTSTNEDRETHVSTKNIVPLQHITYLDNIGCFVDFSPPNSTHSLSTVQDMESGKVIYNDKIIVDNKFKCKNYRGSTPFIEIENNLWISIVHKRINSKRHTHNIKYDYILVVFDSKTVNVDNNEIKLPNKCIQEQPLNANIFEKDFIYITGMIVLDKKIDIVNDLSELKELETMLSYGISDNKSGISKLTFKIINT
jgi:hypothetical protein